MLPLQQILGHTLKSLGVEKKLLELSVFDVWEKYIGSDVRQHANPIKIKGGILTVAVNQPVWSHHLLLIKMTLIGVLNKNIGKKIVKDIRFIAGNSDKRTNLIQDELEEKTVFDPKLTSEQEVNIAQIIKNIVPEYREAVADVLRLQKKSQIYKVSHSWGKCASCGRLTPPKQIQCSLCRSNDKQKKIRTIRRSIKEAPWLHYEEYEFKNISRGEYTQVRYTLLTELLNTLKQFVRFKNDKPSKEIKDTLHLYVMIREQKMPNEVTNELVRQSVGDKIYKTIFKAGS